MAVLSATTCDVELILRPYRIADEGQPTWILTQLELRQDGGTLLSTSLSVTAEDLAELRAGLCDVAAGCREEFAITTTDDDFVLEARRLGSPGDIAIGFWTGEPYALMQGYRFVAAADEVGRFADALQSDGRAIAPLSHR